MRVAEFALLDECPRHADGSPLAISSLSDYLKGWAAKIKKGRLQGKQGRKGNKIDIN